MDDRTFAAEITEVPEEVRVRLTGDLNGRADETHKRTLAELDSKEWESLSAGAWFAGFHPEWKLGAKVLPLMTASAQRFVGPVTLAGITGEPVATDMWDAYVNAAMILGGMGPVAELHTTGGKLFAGTYALFAGIVFLVGVSAW